MSIKEYFVKWVGGMTESLKLWAVQLVVQAENELPGSTGAEKRSYVVAQLDEMVKLPWYVEPFDGPAFGLLVDLVCEKLNLLTDRDITAVSASTIMKVAKIIDVDSNEIKSTSGLSIDERIELLYKKYGIKS